MVKLEQSLHRGPVWINPNYVVSIRDSLQYGALKDPRESEVSLVDGQPYIVKGTPEGVIWQLWGDATKVDQVKIAQSKRPVRLDVTAE